MALVLLRLHGLGLSFVPVSVVLVPPPPTVTCPSDLQPHNLPQHRSRHGAGARVLCFGGGRAGMFAIGSLCGTPLQSLVCIKK